MVASVRGGCDGEFTDKPKIGQLMTGSTPLLELMSGRSLGRFIGVLFSLVAANSSMFGESVVLVMQLLGGAG